jgi:hypothetical protein
MVWSERRQEVFGTGTQSWRREMLFLPCAAVFSSHMPDSAGLRARI